MSGADQTIKIAFDVMGGDFAPANEIKGALEFLQEHHDKSVELLLVGNEDIIKQEIDKNPAIKDYKFTIVNATQVITMEDDASTAIKTKKDSSISVGLDLVKEKKADAFVSAGNTGAMLSTSTLKLGRIDGVSRPTIGSFFPTLKDYPTLILDVGANSEVKPKYLYEFAVMGQIYLSEMYNIENPKIGLLNIGEEAKKGTEIVQEAHKLLSNSKLNFIGNIEGRDIFPGVADIVVCDGFVGNIVLKFAESFMGFFKETLKKYAQKSTFNKLKVGLMVPTVKDIFRGFDYQDHGGVPLLGVNGVVVIGHGKSSPKALKNMLNIALITYEKEINQKIENSLRTS
jgi:glycerol-3-phosphate acyltransferase PlsX